MRRQWIGQNTFDQRVMKDYEGNVILFDSPEELSFAAQGQAETWVAVPTIQLYVGTRRKFNAQKKKTKP